MLNIKEVGLFTYLGDKGFITDEVTISKMLEVTFLSIIADVKLEHSICGDYKSGILYSNLNYYIMYTVVDDEVIFKVCLHPVFKKDNKKSLDETIGLENVDYIVSKIKEFTTMTERDDIITLLEYTLDYLIFAPYLTSIPIKSVGSKNNIVFTKDKINVYPYIN